MKSSSSEKKLNKKVLNAAWACHNKKWHTYQLWDQPLRDKFQKVITFDPQEVFYKYGKDEMNKRFLEVLRNEKPDYIFLWLMYHEFDLDTLIKIKKILPNSIIFCYNGDDDYKFDNYTINYFPMIDYFMITQVPYIAQADKGGKKAFYGCGADITKFKPSNLKKDIDVSFVGTPKSERVNYMRHLLNNGVNIRVFGAAWQRYPEFKDHFGGEIDEKGFIEVINRSKISICLSQNYFGGTHILERFFEINACKSFCLTEYASGYFPTFKEGIDIATFKNKDELLSQVNYYLKNDKKRESIANKAYLRSTKDFSNHNLLSNLIAYAEKNGPRIKGLDKISKKVIYLTKSDLKKGKDYLSNKTNGYDYIGFRQNRYKNLPYKDYFQVHALEFTNKPMCSSDLLVKSSIIGDCSSLALHYAYDYLDKKYFYDNLKIAQLMAKRDYFLKNYPKFLAMYYGKPAIHVKRENTVMSSLPLVSTSKVPLTPTENIEHVLFPYYGDKLLAIKNQGKLWANSYPYKIIIYSLLFNRDLLKHIIKRDFSRSKIKLFEKISNKFK